MLIAVQKKEISVEKDFSGFDIIVFDETGNYAESAFSTDETVVLQNRNPQSAETTVINAVPVSNAAKTTILK